MTSPTLFVVSLLLATPAGAAQAPASASAKTISAPEVIALLDSPDLDRKGEGLNLVAGSRSFQEDPRVRAVVVRELTSMTRRRKDAHQRGDRVNHREAELLLALIRTTARFDGVQVIDALLPHVGESAIAQRRIAAYELPLVDALLGLYRSGEGASEPELVRFGALKTLAAITHRGSLSAEQRTAVAAAARSALQSDETFVFAGGMYLGAATHQPDLLQPAVRARSGDFGGRKLSESDSRFLRGAGQRALEQAGISAR